MVGMPARISRIGLTALRTRRLAYSLRSMAEPSPGGIAKTIAQRVTLRVATTIGRTPKLAGVKVGPQSVPNRKSVIETSPKNWIDGTTSEMTIAVVVTTDSTAHPARRAKIAFSP